MQVTFDDRSYMAALFATCFTTLHLSTVLIDLSLLPKLRVQNAHEIKKS